MRNTLTVVDRPTPAYWTVRIPRPRLPLISRATIRWTAALALSLGFNVGFVLDAHGAERFQPTEECQASAELHYAISGGEDDAYEDALEACNEGMTFTEWRGYEPSECEEYAGAIYDQTGVPEDYEAAYHACSEGE